MCVLNSTWGGRCKSSHVNPRLTHKSVRVVRSKRVFSRHKHQLFTTPARSGFDSRGVAFERTHLGACGPSSSFERVLPLSEAAHSLSTDAHTPTACSSARPEGLTKTTIHLWDGRSSCSSRSIAMSLEGSVFRERQRRPSDQASRPESGRACYLCSVRGVCAFSAQRVFRSRNPAWRYTCQLSAVGGDFSCAQRSL